MSWNAQRAEARIRKFLTTVPVVEDSVTLAKYAASLREAKRRGSLGELSTRRTFLVEGAHVYGQLLNFDSLVAEQGRETEQSHARVLGFLHDYYRLWDAVVDGEDSHRVDYHGARLHAVVTEPAGNPAEQVAQAVALARKLGEAAKQLGAAHGFDARIRFGIDHGRCLAMTTGRAHEQDTLFLGAPANHAAKKAVEANVEGIFLVGGAQRAVDARVLAKSQTGETLLTDEYIRRAVERYRFGGVDRTVMGLLQERQVSGDKAKFRFHRHTPPAAGMKFSDLVPSNSVRMGMAALFADIDGFTAYVDNAIRGDAQLIKSAVRTIHVIREELNAVLQEDFGGKRVRFIGDCIHGCIAAGQVADDAAEAIEKALLCAHGMRSSFDLCVRLAQPGADLDLAVGIDYGPVPVTRLGMPGNDSVRCAASRAVVQAERVQQSIVGGGIKLGASAVANASVPVRKNFATVARLVGYPAVVDLMAKPTSPAVQIIREHPTARPHAAMMERIHR